jgi:hypothetical protein
MHTLHSGESGGQEQQALCWRTAMAAPLELRAERATETCVLVADATLCCENEATVKVQRLKITAHSQSVVVQL